MHILSILKPGDRVVCGEGTSRQTMCYVGPALLEKNGKVEIIVCNQVGILSRYGLDEVCLKQLPMDTVVYVQLDGPMNWSPAHVAKHIIKANKLFVWRDGRTSHTVMGSDYDCVEVMTFLTEAQYNYKKMLGEVV